MRVSVLQKAYFTATHVTFQQRNFGFTPPLPVKDAFLVSLQFLEVRSNQLWLAGQHQRSMPAQPHDITIYDLSDEPTVDIQDPFDSLLMYIPRAALLAASEELGVPTIAGFGLAPGTSMRDPIAAHLAASLLPLVDRPAFASDLVVDHVAASVCMHLVRTYGAIKPPTLTTPAPPSHRQLERAKELLRAHLGGNITLEQLASECGLSRSHLSRTFKESTGQTPHGWLTEQRIAASRDLLANPSLSLSEVARLCGFANQSHFTRVFTRAEGVGPGAWRRAHRRRASALETLQV